MNKKFAKMLVPALRFPEFRDAGPWQIEALGSKTIKIGSGITPTGGDTNYKTEGLPFVRSQNIGWGCLILENVAYIDKVTHATFLATEIMQGDVLLNITGASIGRSAVADQSIEGGNVNQHVCIIRAIADKLNPYFLNQFLLSDGGQVQVDSFQAGGNRQGLNFVQIRSFAIPVPPLLHEQQKIANCLASIDVLISAQSQKVEALKTHKKGLMQQLFPSEDEAIPRLRFPAFRDSVAWEEKQLGEIADVRDGTHESPIFYSAGYPFITSRNLLENGELDLDNIQYISEVDFNSFNKRSKVDTGDILFGMIGTIGRPVLVKTSKFAFKNMAIIKKKYVENSFIIQCINSPHVTNQIKRESVGNSQKFIALGKIRELWIILPCSAEQQKIAACLTSIDVLITAQTQKLESLKTHKKGLMQALFPAPDEVEA